MATEIDVKELKQKKDDSSLKIPKILVADVESTNLHGIKQGDLVLSIGISEVDVVNQTVEPYFDEILGYDTNKWPDDKLNSWIFDNSNLKLEDINKAYNNNSTLENIANKFNKAVDGRWIAFYNRDFDYGRFIKHSPFDIDEKRVLPCLMLASAPACCLPGYYGSWKWPKLEEAVSILLDSETKDYLNKSQDYHNSLFDTEVSGFVMLKLIEEGFYNIMEYIKMD